jgi:hypothetical protein
MFQKKDVFDLSPKCTTPQLQLLMMNHTVTENFRFYRNISAGLHYFLPNICIIDLRDVIFAHNILAKNDRQKISTEKIRSADDGVIHH